MKQLIERYLLRDLIRAYPDIEYFDRNDLTGCLIDIYSYTNIPFIFIIDEWDCIFWEYECSAAAQKSYLDFLRNLLKRQHYVAPAYMTGILPIKKYGPHSALNMFNEFSMTNPGPLASYVGFTDAEVQNLCSIYHMDHTEIQRWYDGYSFAGAPHIYSPRSVVNAMLMQSYDSFWNKTETFEALRDYIALNYYGLKDTVIELLSGTRKKINTNTFTNDMTSFSSAGWDIVASAIKKSDGLLNATFNKDCQTVAAHLNEAHMETSIFVSLRNISNKEKEDKLCGLQIIGQIMK